MEFQPDYDLIVDGLNDTAAGVAPTWNPIYQGYVDRPTQIAAAQREAAVKEPLYLKILKLSRTFAYFAARNAARAQIQRGVVHPEVWEQYFNYMEQVYGGQVKGGSLFGLLPARHAAQ